MYLPLAETSKEKKIFLTGNFINESNIELILDSRCPVNSCVITINKTEADAVIFKNNAIDKRDSTASSKQVRNKNYKNYSLLFDTYKTFVDFKEILKMTPPAHTVVGRKCLFKIP